MNGVNYICILNNGDDEIILRIMIVVIMVIMIMIYGNEVIRKVIM